MTTDAHRLLELAEKLTGIWLNVRVGWARYAEELQRIIDGNDKLMDVFIEDLNDLSDLALDLRRDLDGRPHEWPICMDCDGCGWVDGGESLKATCSACKGTGREPRVEAEAPHDCAGEVHVFVHDAQVCECGQKGRFADLAGAKAPPDDRSRCRCPAGPHLASCRRNEPGIPSQCGEADSTGSRCLLDHGHTGKHSWEVGEVDPQPAAPQDYKALYFELLYQVGNKYPGESRHDTALRYLRQAEAPKNHQACVAAPADQEKPK